LLVAEVLSPPTKKGDRIVKRDRYLRHPVPTYWIIDAVVQSVVVWSPGTTEPRVVTVALTCRFGDAAPAFVLSLAELRA
jgi:Uma2 family endonuclease